MTEQMTVISGTQWGNELQKSKKQKNINIGIGYNKNVTVNITVGPELRYRCCGILE